MFDLRDVYSLSAFQRQTRKHIRRLRRTRRPAVLTVNGKAELVVQDAESYQESLARFGPGGSRHSGRAVGLPLDPDPVVEAYKKDVDRTLLRENLRRTVDDRVRGLVALQRLAAEAGRAGRSLVSDAR